MLVPDHQGSRAVRPHRVRGMLRWQVGERLPLPGPHAPCAPTAGRYAVLPRQQQHLPGRCELRHPRRSRGKPSVVACAQVVSGLARDCRRGREGCARHVRAPPPLSFAATEENRLLADRLGSARPYSAGGKCIIAQCGAGQDAKGVLRWLLRRRCGSCGPRGSWHRAASVRNGSIGRLACTACSAVWGLTPWPPYWQPRLPARAGGCLLSAQLQVLLARASSSGGQPAAWNVVRGGDGGWLADGSPGTSARMIVDYVV